MNDYKIEVPLNFIEFAKTMAPILVPKSQTQGFKDPNNPRGNGDFIELLSRITIFHHIAMREKVCNLILVCGEGDPFDMVVKIKGKDFIWDVKASSYAPYGEGLHLFIIQEYLSHKTDGYIQTFVHLDEDYPPHIHIAGIISTLNPVFIESKKTLVTIPNTNHLGIQIAIEKLAPFQLLLNRADTK